jgi:hypothetical protein
VDLCSLELIHEPFLILDPDHLPAQVKIGAGVGRGIVKADGGLCRLTILRAQVQAES